MTIGSVKAQDFSQQLIDQYPNYLEKTINHRRFKHRDLVPLVEKLSQLGFRVELAGKSYLDRDIYLISIGNGPTTILLWSQMHGNEATATMALFDIFNYLGRTDSGQVQQLLSQVTLYFIPMLNPDGAELFQRRTIQGIDMNRDALALSCPESSILKSVRDSIQADWGFNLHDQNIYYNVGDTEKPATISFLAPAYNQSKEVNPRRKQAMQVIAVMNETLQAIIPGQIGKYDDTFEPRAFGDNMQKWGTRTMLIESGGFSGDPEKQFIRKLNYLAILTALYTIGQSGYDKYKVDLYHDIPLNNSDLNDVIIRKVQVDSGQGRPFLVDIAIRREEFDVDGQAPVFYQGSIEDVGDLSTQYGYQEIDEDGLEYVPARVYPEVLADAGASIGQQINELMRQGYLFVRVKQEPTRPDSDGRLEQSTYQLPFDVVNAGFMPPSAPEIDQPATFLLQKDGVVKYAVINGFVHEIDGETNSSANGWIHK